jgi:hypothetical protein
VQEQQEQQVQLVLQEQQAQLVQQVLLVKA